MKTRISILIIGLVSFVVSCNRNDRLESYVVRPDDDAVDAGSFFPESGNIDITHSLMLESRNDGTLLLTCDIPSSTISSPYQLYPGDAVVKPSSVVYSSTETVSSGTTRVAFHLEFPRTIEWALPEEIKSVQSIRLMNGSLVSSIALDPDFPYSEANFEQATVSMPAWVRQTTQSYMNGNQLDLNEWEPSGLLYPEAETLFWDHFDGIYTLGEGEGIQEPGHRLVLDATISVDGILTVDEKNRKDPKEASTPWSYAFFSPRFEFDGYFTEFTGCVDLSREMNDCSRVFSRVPSFLQENGMVLDLNDVHAALVAYSRNPIPVAVSGTLLGDDREYPFSSSTFLVPSHDEDFIVLLSEKGNRVKEGMSPEVYLDVPVPGISGLIDDDPVSIGLKNVRMATNPNTPGKYHFGEGSFTIRPVLQTPLRIGKDFQTGTRYLNLLTSNAIKLERISGTYTIENTFPFDFEVRPVFCDWNMEQLPISFESITIPAGSRESPYKQTVTVDWPFRVQFAHVFLEVKGHTAEGRQGEDLNKDQHIAVKDIALELFYEAKK